MVDKVIILIDGSNFYNYLKGMDIKPRLKYDYSGLAKFLAKKNKIVSSTYYVGVVKADKSKKSQDMRANQQRLFAWLRRCNWKIEYGHLQKNDGVYHEKGVDVHMAVDMVRGAYMNEFDKAILVSSDNDLIPAIKSVKEAGKKVEYVGFNDRPSMGIIRYASEITLLKKDEVEQFLPVSTTK